MEGKMSIVILLKMLYNSLAAQRNKDMEEIELTASQSDIMIYLIHNNDREVNQRDIELELKLMNPTVTGILKRLEKKGFIARVKSEVDRRYKIVKLTERGREILWEMVDKAVEIDKRLLNGFSESEIDSLRDTLKRLIDNISKKDAAI